MNSVAPPPRAEMPTSPSKIISYKGIDVHFPFQPYEPQRTFINSLVEALRSGKNALLESPTGTGKTLCLLCGALAWQKAVSQGIAPHPATISKRPHSTLADSATPALAEQLDFGRPAEPLLPGTPSLMSRGENSLHTSSLRSNAAWEALAGSCSGSSTGRLASGATLASNLTNFRSNPSKVREIFLKYANPDSSSSVGTSSSTQSESSRLTTDAATCTGSSEGSAKMPGVPKIYFVSRTHSQLSQVVSELRKTTYVNQQIGKVGFAPENYSDHSTDQNECVIDANYDFFKEQEKLQNTQPISGATAPTMNRDHEGTTLRPATSERPLKVVAIGARDHLCIHPDLQRLKGSALNAACQQKLKRHTCHFEGGLAANFKSSLLLEPLDIEDLRKLGHRRGFCPYYAAKEHHADCDLLLLPYEYILNSSMRKSLQLRLEDSVIIFDEGHNLAKSAEEAGSFDITLNMLNQALEGLRQYCSISSLENQSTSTAASSSEKITAVGVMEVSEMILEPLERFIEEIVSEDLGDSVDDYGRRQRVYPGLHLRAILEKVGFIAQRREFYHSAIPKVSEALLGYCSSVTSSSNMAATLVASSTSGSASTAGDIESIAAAVQIKALGELGVILALGFSESLQHHYTEWFKLVILETEEQNLATRRRTGNRSRRFSLEVPSTSLEDSQR